MTAPLLSVEDLRVEFPTRRSRLVAVDGVSFSLARGEVLGVVGESGAGKSLTGSAIIGLLDPPGRMTGGRIFLEGRRIDDLPPGEIRRVRGRKIGTIFQDPLTSLDPLFSVGDQIAETVRVHLGLDPAEARRRAAALLDQVGIPAAEQRLDHYPHQFSGGMRQRVVIALALAAEPLLIVADEPTTALDVSIQAQVIALLRRLCRERNTAVLLITHDMGVIAEIADRVAVMYAGRLVEIGPVRDLVKAPHHPYTAGLMAAIPRLDQAPGPLTHVQGAMPRLDAIPAGCPYHPRCPSAFDRCRKQRPDLQAIGASRVACWLFGPDEQSSRTFSHEPAMTVPSSAPVAGVDRRPLLRAVGLSRDFDVSAPLLDRLIEGKGRAVLTAVDTVDFEVGRGETLALVGESGCGKSTVAKLVVGLHRPSRGIVEFDGVDLAALATRARMRPFRRRLQMIFQDPYASLNPRWRVRDIIGEPILVETPSIPNAELRNRVDALLRSVNLTPSDGGNYPHEFSGGQRQRISIARALAARPDFLVCDEPTSSLDVSVQAQILNLMKDLQRERGLTYLFISHNLAVVRNVSDRVGVMYLGRLVEVAETITLFAAPAHPYTRLLLDTVPDLAMVGRSRTPVAGEVPSPLNPPTGCGFHPRCPLANSRCKVERPLPRPRPGGEVACHAVEENRVVI